MSTNENPETTTILATYTADDMINGGRREVQVVAIDNGPGTEARFEVRGSDTNTFTDAHEAMIFGLSITGWGGITK